ncbi:MAG: hypothetical protein ACK4K9_05985 [Bacteroidia bacterium]
MRIKDNLVIGLLAGLLGPSIGILIFYFINFSNSPIHSFIEIGFEQKIFSPLLSLCCVVNLGIFYLFIHFEHYLSARGVILATFLYGFVIVALKFFV